jgi:hypothetical protein
MTRSFRTSKKNSGKKPALQNMAEVTNLQRLVSQVHSKQGCARPKSGFSGARLWTSNWISTARDVQKQAFCQAALICPIIALSEYRLFTHSVSDAKYLILCVKVDLSTKKAAFTTTTKIYIYKLT